MQSSSGLPSLSSDSSESDIIARVEAAENKITKNYGAGWVYYGQMEGGKRHGYGTLTWADGEKYVGEWNKNKKHGYGTYTYASGTIETGEWVNGVDPNPQTCTYSQGTFTNANGTIYHSGEWVHVNSKPKK